MEFDYDENFYAELSFETEERPEIQVSRKRRQTRNSLVTKKQKTTQVTSKSQNPTSPASNSSHDIIFSNFINESIKIQKQALITTNEINTRILEGVIKDRHKIELLQETINNLRDDELKTKVLLNQSNLTNIHQKNEYRKELDMLNKKVVELTDREIEHKKQIETFDKIMIEHKKEIENVNQKQHEEIENLKRASASVINQNIEYKKEIETFTKNKKEPLKSDILYTEEILTKYPDKCIDIYGFTADNIIKIHNYLESTKIKKTSYKGCRQTYSSQTKFLFTLYFLKHYETLVKMKEKFHVSSGFLQESIDKVIQEYSLELFNWSTSSELSHQSLPLSEEHESNSCFIHINKPENAELMLQFYNKDTRKYGIYLNYTVNLLSQKVISFELGKSSINNNEKDDDFKKRMKSKFMIVSVNYRGDPVNLTNIFQFVIALTNLNIEFENNIKSL